MDQQAPQDVALALRTILRRTRILLVSFLVPLLLGGACTRGCATFDGQTIVVRNDPARDTLDVLLVYRGLRADGPLDDAVAQVEQARGRRVMTVGGPWCTLDLDGALGKPATGSLPQALAGCEVHDLGLWLDAEGRLCGAQHVHLDDVAAVVRTLNDALRSELLADDQQLAGWLRDFGLDRPGDVGATRERLEAEEHFPFVTITSGVLTLSFPLAAEQPPRIRAMLLTELAKLQSEAEAGKPSAVAERRLLLENPISVLTEADRVLLVLGDEATGELRLELRSDRPPSAVLTDALRARGSEIDGPETEARVRAAFDKATGR